MRGKNGIDIRGSRRGFTHSLGRCYREKEHNIEGDASHTLKYDSSPKNTKRLLACKRTGAKNYANLRLVANHGGTEKVQYFLDGVGDRVNAASREEKSDRVRVSGYIFYH